MIRENVAGRCCAEFTKAEFASRSCPYVLARSVAMNVRIGAKDDFESRAIACYVEFINNWIRRVATYDSKWLSVALGKSSLTCHRLVRTVKKHIASVASNFPSLRFAGALFGSATKVKFSIDRFLAAQVAIRSSRLPVAVA